MSKTTINIEYCIGDEPGLYKLPVERWFCLGGECPAWLTLVYELPSTSYFTFTAFDTPGVYSVVLTDDNEPEADFIVITITVTDCSIQPICVKGNCQTNIAWLNTHGGWSSYVFGSTKNRKINGREIGGEITYKKYDANTGSVYEYTTQTTDVSASVQVISGFIPIAHLNFVEQLKYSVQAYLWNDDTSAFDIPVKIDKQSFELFRCGNGFAQFSFKFIYSERINVQSQ